MAQVVSTAIDFSPILQQGLEFLGLIVLALAAWATKKVCDYFNLKQDDSARALIQTAVVNGVKFAQAKLSVAVSGLSPVVDVGHPVVAEAANYVIEHVPDALQRLGITEKQLADKVLAALPQ